jgi:cysteinyl-tRNA synthetase
MHVRHLMVNGEKMAKSRGNFYTLKDLIAKGYTAKAVRYLLLSANYRTSLNFTEDGLVNAAKTVSGLIDFVDKIKYMNIDGNYNNELDDFSKDAKKKFEESMDDDLNTSLALASIFDLVSQTNKAIDERKVSKKNLAEIYDIMMDFDKVLGVLEHDKGELPDDIADLINRREESRKAKDFAKADMIRKEILDKGFIVEDSPQGPRWKKVNQ